MKFYWLLEISVDGRAAWLQDGMKYTHDAWSAKKFNTKEEAIQCAEKNRLHKYLIEEHGFCGV